jgi:hypothetical protein
MFGSSPRPMCHPNFCPQRLRIARGKAEKGQSSEQKENERNKTKKEKMKMNVAVRRCGAYAAGVPRTAALAEGRCSLALKTTLNPSSSFHNPSRRLPALLLSRSASTFRPAPRLAGPASFSLSSLVCRRRYSNRPTPSRQRDDAANEQQRLTVAELTRSLVESRKSGTLTTVQLYMGADRAAQGGSLPLFGSLMPYILDQVDAAPIIALRPDEKHVRNLEHLDMASLVVRAVLPRCCCHDVPCPCSRSWLSLWSGLSAHASQHQPVQLCPAEGEPGGQAQVRERVAHCVISPHSISLSGLWYGTAQEARAFEPGRLGHLRAA